RSERAGLLGGPIGRPLLSQRQGGSFRGLPIGPSRAWASNVHLTTPGGGQVHVRLVGCRMPCASHSPYRTRSSWLNGPRSLLDLPTMTLVVKLGSSIVAADDGSLRT